MAALHRVATCLWILCAALPCPAQPAPLASPPAAAASAPATAASQAAGVAPHLHVIEDRRVRIEETRLGGQAQRITVQSKIPGVRPYEIIVDPAGRDPEKGRGATGQSAWSLFDF